MTKDFGLCCSNKFLTYPIVCVCHSTGQGFEWHTPRKNKKDVTELNISICHLIGLERFCDILPPGIQCHTRTSPPVKENKT